MGAAVLALVATGGCTDVGDDAASGGDDSGFTSPLDATVSLDDAAPTPLPEGGSNDAGGAADDATGSPDVASTGDALDGASSDATDAAEVADVADAAADVEEDVSVADAAPADGGPPDAAGAVDAGADAALPVDAGDAGGGGDASIDAGHGLVPCTTAGQTGCVQCQYNDGAEGSLPNTGQLCTPMEAALVAHDVAAGLATAPGPDPAASCYACAAESGCLDDSAFDDTGHECEDLAGAASASACEATLACILGSSCAYASGEVSSCYCGSAPVSGSCAAAGGSNAANGTCASAEAAGLGFPANDGLDILKNFTSTTLPSGVANNVFQCAISNGCTACLH